MTMKHGITLVMLAAALAQGCGTIVHGTEQSLAISTIPAGATARVGTKECVTPCTLRVPRNSEKILIRKGNLKEEYDLPKSFNFGATICGNILWILPGAIIDLVTGGSFTINPVNVRLGEATSR